MKFWQFQHNLLCNLNISHCAIFLSTTNVFLSTCKITITAPENYFHFVYVVLLIMIQPYEAIIGTIHRKEHGMGFVIVESCVTRHTHTTTESSKSNLLEVKQWTGNFWPPKGGHLSLHRVINQWDDYNYIFWKQTPRNFMLVAI